MSAVLQTSRLCKKFGALTVAANIDFALEPGARHALIGPNGAGKTTFVNLLTGRLEPTSGTVLLDGEDVSALSSAQRVKRGLGRTFQINTLFGNMSVLDNVALGVAERRASAAHWWKPASAYAEVRAEALELLASLGIADDAASRVLDLPYGKQRLVEIAIALGLRPKVLLLDEPAAGVPKVESERILAALDTLPAEIAILIIEHDMDLVFRFARRITVLVQGEVLCEGTPREIENDARVREVYLGESHG
ncbi:MAG: ABC transporter ATP-binding protein [Burkholderiales bacterium]|nr:ABC transporter ATP-binding protein [Burkholderiales bacterium]